MNIGPYHLEYLPYMDLKEVVKIIRNPVILNSLHIWKWSHKLLGYKNTLSPFSPIWRNPGISCCGDDTFKLWYDKGIREISHLFERGIFLSFIELQQKYGVPSSHLFRYFQIRHVVNLEHGSLQEPEPSKIDFIMNNMEKNKDKLISKIYSVLTTSSRVNTDYLRQKWEQDLQIEIQQEDWSFICRKVHKCSYNLRHKLALFKIMHRVYYTPEKLNKMNSEISFLCWHCKKYNRFFSYALVM